MGKIIALVNQKGGVGKTTSSINLAASLGVLKKRVLLVDLDPQGNASTGIGIDKSTIKKSIYDLLLDNAELSEAIIKTKFKNLYVIPATINLAGADIELNGKIGRNISIYASSVSLKGSTIEGNVKISANTVNIDKDTIINGDLYYPSDAEVNIDKISVKGEIIKTDAINENDDSFVTLMMGKFWSFMSLILIFAVISLAASKIFTNIQDEYSKFDFNKGLETFTKGLLFVILVPIIIFILLLMSIGIPLALILLAFYFIIMYLSVIFTGYLIGYKLWQRFFNNDINMLVVGIFGLAILFVLNLIPGINFIVSLLSLIIGIGIIYDVIIKKIGSNE